MEASIKRASALADGADIRNFVRVKGGEAEFIDWEELGPELRGVASIEVDQDGCVKKLKVRDPAAMERHLAQMGGWYAAEKTETLDTGPMIQELEEAWQRKDEAAGHAVLKIAQGGRVGPIYAEWIRTTKGDDDG